MAHKGTAMQTRSGSVSRADQEAPEQPVAAGDHPAGSDEQGTLYKLQFIESLTDPQVSAHLVRVIKSANQDLLDTLGALRDEVRSLKQTVAEGDATIAQMRDNIADLQDKHDALEQYGRRNCLRIAGVSDTEEDTTAAVVYLANEVLKVQPPLDKQDITNSHRLPKPRNSPNDQPCPIIIRFNRKTDRDRVLKNRKHLKAVNIGKPVKIYINEDLTTQRAKLFSVGRSLLKDKHIEQVWTFNGNIKIKTLSGHVKSIQNINDFKACLPNVNIRTWFDRSLVTIIIHFYILSITALDDTLVAVDALVTESLQHLQLQGWLVFLLH